jgi:hypothetical protein
MSEQVDLEKQPLVPGGPLAFLQLTPEDIRRIGDAYILLAASTIHNFIIRRGGDDVVWGADFALKGGLNFDIFKPLEMWRGVDGKHFEDFDLAPKSFTVPTPDATHPRIDRVYAKWEENVNGLVETRHVKVLPTDPNSQEGDISAAVTKRNKLTLFYLQGEPSSNPVVPPLPSDSVELWQIFVPANAVGLSTASFRDERHNFLTLEEVSQKLLELFEIINIIKLAKHRHPADFIDVDQTQLAPGTNWITAQDAFNDLSRKKGGGGDTPPPVKSSVRSRPEILRPDVLPSHANSGLLGATGILDEGGASAVEYPHPRQVDFNGTIRTLAPEAFADPALNARLVNKSAQGANESKSLTTPVSLANIVVEETNGGGVYELQNHTSPASISHGNVGNRRIAPRNSQIIDLFGVGDVVGGPSGQWLEFDTVAGTFTPRAITGDIPAYGISFACTLGNGKVLLAGPAGTAIAEGKGRIKWFLLDTATRISTAIANGPGDVATSQLGDFNIMGDLVIGGPNGIVSLVVWGEGIPTQTFVAQYEYHINSNTFTQLQVTGSGPSWFRPDPKFLHMDACVFKQGELVVVDGSQGPGRTYVFNHASSSWRQINISQPTTIVPNPFTSGFLWGLSISNVNGRIHLASGSSTIWELVTGTTSVWNQVRVPALEDANGAARWGAFMSGMLVNGLAMGVGYLIGGTPSTGPINVQFHQQVWRFSPGGIVATQCGGENGITLGGDSTTATMRLPNTAQGFLPWAVGRYIITVKGQFQPGQVKAVVSFDDEAHTLEVALGENTVIVHSNNNPVRILRLVLSGTGANKPCVSSITETFEDQAGPGLDELVVRFNPPEGTRYMIVDRDTGQITLQADAEQTSVPRCYALKITRVANNAPTLVNIVNKPFIDRVYRITQAQASIPNDFPVDPPFIFARKLDANGFYKDMTTPAAPFNDDITPAGLGANEVCVLELRG